MSAHADSTEIERVVHDYIRRQFLPDVDDVALGATTPLISGGILSSISMVKLVSFLEGRYRIRFPAHEISEDYLDTVGDIVRSITEKLPS